MGKRIKSKIFKSLVIVPCSKKLVKEEKRKKKKGTMLFGGQNNKNELIHKIL